MTLYLLRGLTQQQRQRQQKAAPQLSWIKSALFVELIGF